MCECVNLAPAHGRRPVSPCGFRLAWLSWWRCCRCCVPGPAGFCLCAVPLLAAVPLPRKGRWGVQACVCCAQGHLPGPHVAAMVSCRQVLRCPKPDTAVFAAFPQSCLYLSVVKFVGSVSGEIENRKSLTSSSHLRGRTLRKGSMRAHAANHFKPVMATQHAERGRKEVPPPIGTMAVQFPAIYFALAFLACSALAAPVGTPISGRRLESLRLPHYNRMIRTHSVQKVPRPETRCPVRFVSVFGRHRIDALRIRVADLLGQLSFRCMPL